MMDNTITAYLLRHVALLKQEYEYEREAYRVQGERDGVMALVEKGVCRYPVDIQHKYYNAFNKLTIEVTSLVSEEDEVRDNLFEPGKLVTFFIAQENNKLHYLNILGRVSFARDTTIVVELDNFEAYLALRNRSDLGIQLHFDNASYRCMFEAMSAILRAKDNRAAYLRDTLLSSTPLRLTASKESVLHFSWLNASQNKAVRQVLATPEVAIIHGPPGTGKTTTLVEAVYETLRRENQVLVCAQSNTAVDWISEKLVDRGLHVLRIGNPTKVNDKMLSFTYERRFASHSLFGQLRKQRTEYRNLLAAKRKGGSSRSAIREKIGHAKIAIETLEQRIASDLFSEARVIACTLVGAANKELEQRHFSTLFIDEAAQALQAACWIPMLKCDRVIFAGDHCQLPPTIKNNEAFREGLAETLMEKVAILHPEVVSLLTLQYRMHQAIMEFSSQWFYSGKMEAATEVANRTILQWDMPIEWVDTMNLESSETLTRGGSRLNTMEAQLTVRTLKTYIQNIGIERVQEEQIDFGIISPYRAQVNYIRQLIKSNAFFRPIRSLLTVHTVDGFQGQERDVIVLSMVRSNDKHNIGFLGDLRRMNVAITRARMKLIILGNHETLERSPFYMQFYQYVKRLNSVEVLEAEYSEIQQ